MIPSETRSEIHGQASGESNIKLSDDGNEHEEYGVNNLNFDALKN